MKRNDYISWDYFFMGVAELAAKRSKDPNTQVGCCIVKDKRIIGVGYNGMPNGCDDDKMPWVASKNFVDSKYTYVVHAELNAILNTFVPHMLKGSTMYCTLAPCNECAKAIIQSGIKNIVIRDDFGSDDYHIAAKIMFKKTNIIISRYQ